MPSWTAWSARDPLTRRAMEQMLQGVSTRHYARSLEPLPPGLQQRAIVLCAPTTLPLTAVLWPLN